MMKICIHEKEILPGSNHLLQNNLPILVAFNLVLKLYSNDLSSTRIDLSPARGGRYAVIVNFRTQALLSVPNKSGD